jgi:hypothetical protein
MNFHEGGYRMRTFNQGKITDSAVSEIVGFMIIFGIMLSGIGLITLYGYPMLLQEQQNTNIRNMERNMILLQSDVNALVYKNVPYKETTMQVSGGTLRVDPGAPTSSFIITVDGAPVQGIPSSMGEIYYESQDGTTTIGLENGAVHTRMSSSSGGSAMLAEPRWFYDTTDPNEKTFVMTFIRIDSSDYLAQTGIGTVKMMLTPPADPNIILLPNGGNSVVITYTPNPKNDYTTSWSNYFDSPELMMQGSKPGPFNLDPDADKLVIKTYTVTVLSL